MNLRIEVPANLESLLRLRAKEAEVSLTIGFQLFTITPLSQKFRTMLDLLRQCSDTQSSIY